MEKVEYIRTLKTDSKSVLLIFRVLHECYLSEIKLVFEHEDSIRLPKVKVEKGYFIWVTNMEREEVNQIISNNSSNTKTIIAVSNTIVITAVVLFATCFGDGHITFFNSALKSFQKCLLFSFLFFASLAILYPP